MRSFSYAFFDDDFNGGLNKNSRDSSEWPFMVNCTGAVSISSPFTTYNSVGRSDYYLMYIVGGRLTVSTDGGDAVAQTGDFIIFPPGYKYKYTFADEGSISYYYAHFTGSEVAKTLHALGLPLDATVCTARYSVAAAEAFSEIFAAYTENGEFRDLSAGVAVKRTLIALARARAGERRPSPIERSLAYIKASYTDDLSIPSLAAMDGLSVSRYNAVFRAQTGTSPVRFITGLRLGHACTLLSSTDLAVGVIGNTVGYRDNHFFSKIFKTYIGLSPKEYRVMSLKGGKT